MNSKCKSKRYHLCGGFLGLGLSLVCALTSGLAVSAAEPIAALTTFTAPPAAQAAAASALATTAIAFLTALRPLGLNRLRPQRPGPRLHLRLSYTQLGLNVSDAVVVQRVVVMSPD